MRILVLIKQVPMASDVSIDPLTGVIQRESGDAKLNPYDLFALETALRLAGDTQGETVVLTMGPPQAETAVREAFAMGVNEGYLLPDRAFAGSDVLATAYALSQAIGTLGRFDLIIGGKQTTDGDTAQVGPEVSEFLGIPCITSVIRIDGITAKALTLTYDTGTSNTTCTVALPALISVDKDINQPRLPSYRRMQATASQGVKRLTLKDLDDTNAAHYGLEGSATQVVRIFPPEHTTQFEIWEEAGAANHLYTLLKSEKFLQEMA